MTRPFGSLRTRLMASYLVVVLIGAVTLVMMVELLAPAYFEGDVRSMNEMMMAPDMTMDGMISGQDMPDMSHGFLTPTVEQGLRDAFAGSLRRALVVALLVAGLAGMAIASFATRRILAPLASVRRVTRRMAGGSYEERVELPAEVELAAVAQDVNALAQALDETEQRRVRLISEVAHELRTPLTTIEGYVEGLLDGVFEPTPEMLAAWDREIRRLKRLTEDLGALSRAEEGAQPLDFEELDVTELVGQVIERLRGQFEVKGVTVEIERGEELRVRGDRDRLSQVFINVIGNALAYTPPGGQVSVDIRSEGPDALVRVTDTGLGLTSEQQTQVFERFYRADHSVPGGTGIGLTIARGIARQHGGDITATSTGLGEGATFVIRIPLV
ncbi:signal transduction histidine-protein kinase BaeS [bacterium BMS3Abin02]|nr:signal transduction histidine-protein kinase BaeS [bacterium BMS3Abin02]HDL48688.1 HAMP domain-containing histidine kinase [Actinomycetota bacterium]